MSKGRGWHGERERHRLAQAGVSTTSPGYRYGKMLAGGVDPQFLVADGVVADWSYNNLYRLFKTYVPPIEVQRRWKSILDNNANMPDKIVVDMDVWSEKRFHPLGSKRGFVGYKRTELKFSDGSSFIFDADLSKALTVGERYDMWVDYEAKRPVLLKAESMERVYRTPLVVKIKADRSG